MTTDQTVTLRSPSSMVNCTANGEMANRLSPFPACRSGVCGRVGELTFDCIGGVGDGLAMRRTDPQIGEIALSGRPPNDRVTSHGLTIGANEMRWSRSSFVVLPGPGVCMRCLISANSSSDIVGADFAPAAFRSNRPSSLPRTSTMTIGADASEMRRACSSLTVMRVITSPLATTSRAPEMAPGKLPIDYITTGDSPPNRRYAPARSSARCWAVVTRRSQLA